MKTLKQISILFFMALAFTACSSDDDNMTGDDGGEMGGGSGEEYFRATVDGQPFAADTDLATLIGGQLNDGGAVGNILTAQGSTNSGDFINFNIIGYTGVGTYAVGDDISNASMIMYGELQGSTVQGWQSNGVIALTGAIEPGRIVVTAQNDTSAEGTFSFEGYNGEDETVKVITNGEFKIIFDN